MTLLISGLSHPDTVTLLTLQQAAITPLRKASRQMKLAAKGEDDDAIECSRTWFGDVSTNWLKAVAKDLNMLASLVNVSPIKVHAMPPSQREHAFACSKIKRSENQNYARNSAPLSAAAGKHFEIELHKRWFQSPVFRTAQNPDSRFQTLIHELSHIFLKTEDMPMSEGYDTCQLTASVFSTSAKKNADNWAYFVLDFR